MSTVRGKKSMPSRTRFSALAVASTMVLPMRATTAPWDWGASLPVSKVRVLSVPLTGPLTEMASAIRAPCVLCAAGGPVPSWRAPRSRVGPSARRLAADRSGRCYVERAARRPLEWCSSLPTEPESGDECSITLDVVVLHVVEQAAAPTDEHEEPTPTVMVLLV